MPLTYAEHGKRLMKEQVTALQFGGFLKTEHYPYREHIYAVCKLTGVIATRTNDRPDPNFAAPAERWQLVETVPADAEWIGAYNRMHP